MSDRFGDAQMGNWIGWKLRRSLLVLWLGVLVCQAGLWEAKAEDKLVIISELAYYGDVLFKFRPSYTLKKEVERAPNLEVLLGKPFTLDPFKFVIYADGKSDLEETVHLGPRVSAAYLLHRTYFGCELACFFGLNDESDDHLKAIPYLFHMATDRLNIGLLNVGEYYHDRLSTSVGPFVSYSFNRNLNVLVRYGSDLKGGNRLDLKMNFRSGKGRKERDTP